MESRLLGKPFVLTYTSKRTGVQYEERPRLMVSEDGAVRALVVGEGDSMIRVVAGDDAITEEHLWANARLGLFKSMIAEPTPAHVRRNAGA
jgi:hypothetical protein